MTLHEYIDGALRTNLSPEQYTKSRQHMKENPVLLLKIKGLFDLMTYAGKMADEIKREVFYLKEVKLDVDVAENVTIEPFEELSILSVLTNQPSFTLFHAVMGLITESCEMSDAIKGHMLSADQLDLSHVREELGDLAWYQALSYKAVAEFVEVRPEVVADQVLDRNIEKLSTRYPEKFTPEAATQRADKAPDGRCPRCGHSAHGDFCTNAASDNDCNCTFNSRN